MSLPAFKSLLPVLSGALLLWGLSGSVVAQSATVEGTVTELDGTTPIAGATVAVSDPATAFHFTLATATTNASGAYAVTVPMDPGQTRELVVEAAGADHAPTRHGFSGNLPCYFNCGPGGEISVSEGDTVANIDLALESGGRIAGTITEAATGDPIPGATAGLFTPDLQNYSVEFAGVAQPDGSYTTGLAVAPGTWFLVAGGGASGNYVEQAWDGYPCEMTRCPIADTDPLSVTAGTVTGGFDFALNAGATLSGELLPDDITRIVLLYNAAGRNIAITSIFDLPDSQWSFDRLAGGSYFVQLGPTLSGSDSFLRILHNGLLCPWGGCERARGTPLTLPAGASLSLAPITLDEGGRIEGTIVDGNTGAPPAGVPADAQLGSYDIIDAGGDVVGGGLIRESGGDIVMEPSAAVPPGDYHVRTYSEWVADGIGHDSLIGDAAIEGYMDAVYPDVDCAGILCDLTSAGTVTVTTGNTASITIEISSGSTISGRVVDETSGAPIADAVVRVLDVAGNTAARILTDASGEYHFGGFPAGDYFVRTSMSGDLGPGHTGVQNAYFDRLHGASGSCSEALCDPASATTVVLDGTTDVDLGDLEVAGGPVISGQLIDAGTGLPIDRGAVEIFTDTGEFVGRYKVGFADARYQTTALPPGTYTLVPDVSPAYGSVTSSGGTTPSLAGRGTPAEGFTVVMGEDDVEADLQVVDLAIDRLFSDRFSQTQ